jgi:hypothetical protein
VDVRPGSIAGIICWHTHHRRIVLAVARLGVLHARRVAELVAVAGLCGALELHDRRRRRLALGGTLGILLAAHGLLALCRRVLDADERRRGGGEHLAQLCVDGRREAGLGADEALRAEVDEVVERRDPALHRGQQRRGWQALARRTKTG